MRLAVTADPYQSHLDRAEALFQGGDVVQAGQIWQAILKRAPDHPGSRAGLLRVKQFFDQKDLTAANDVLLQEGCTLYDMGQFREALASWERILRSDPRHPLALAYANNARRELGLAPLPGPTPAPPAPPAPAREGAEDPLEQAEQLVQEGVQIFDLGLAEEAIAKWERALALNPGHPDAPAFLAMARQDRQRAMAAPARAVPESAAIQRDTLLLRAEQALREGRVEEAARTFQQLLEQDPQHPRVLRGYHQVRSLLAAREGAPVTPRSVPLPPAPPLPRPHLPAAMAGPAPAGLPEPVGPPRSLTVRGAAPRDGIHLPQRLQELSRPRWLGSRRHLGLAAGAAALVLTVAGLYGLHRREQALREAVASAKVDALKPVSRLVQVPQLTESPDAIRRECEQALPDDPLTAYFRAQELVRRDPDDPGAAKLAQQARQQLAALPPAGDLAEYDSDLKAGDLEGARKSVLGLLRQDPDNPDLRDRARRVLLALAPLYAAQDTPAKAREALVLGRAMFPRDPAWPARLKLLEAIQALPAAERAAWIPLLG